MAAVAWTTRPTLCDVWRDVWGWWARLELPDELAQGHVDLEHRYECGGDLGINPMAEQVEAEEASVCMEALGQVREARARKLVVRQIELV